MLEMGVDTDDPGFERVRGPARLLAPQRRSTSRGPSFADWPGLRAGDARGPTSTSIAGATRRRRPAPGCWSGPRRSRPIMEDGWVTAARRSARPRTARPSPTDPRAVRDRRRRRCQPVRQAGRREARRVASRWGSPPGATTASSDRPGPWLESWLDLWEGDCSCPATAGSSRSPTARMNLGAGLLNTFKDFKELSAQRLFDAFCRDAARRVGTQRGRRPRAGCCRGRCRWASIARRWRCPGMLLVGDAAGMVNPFNGEGIAYAMEAGEMAAELVHEALVKDRPGIAQMYPTELRERYGRYFRSGDVFAGRSGNPPVMRRATEYAAARSDMVMRFAMRVMANLTDGRGRRRPGQASSTCSSGWCGRRDGGVGCWRRADRLPAGRVMAALAVVFAVVSLAGARDASVPTVPTRSSSRRTNAGSTPSGCPGRAVQREVLHRRDAVHHLRHRDDLPVPVGGRVPPARAVRARWRWRCSSGWCSSPTCTCGARAGSTGRRRAARSADRRERGREAADTRCEGGSPVPVERIEGVQPRAARPRRCEEEVKRGLLLTTLDRAVGWARKQSMWPATFGLACCAIEMMSTGAGQYDLSRWGMELFRASPRQADLMIVAGRVSQKMAPGAAPRLRPDARTRSGSSRWACAPRPAGCSRTTRSCRASTRSSPSTSTCPGCPPKPEMLMYGILKLQEKVRTKEPFK